MYIGLIIKGNSTQLDCEVHWYSTDFMDEMVIGVQERPGDDDQSMAHIAEAIKNQTADLA